MAEEKSIIIKQEPPKLRDAIEYIVSANVWYDEGETKVIVETNFIGYPYHFLVYKSEIDKENIKNTQPIDIGHSIEEASQKAYMHALNIAKNRINYIRANKGIEVLLIDRTIRGAK